MTVPYCTPPVCDSRVRFRVLKKSIVLAHSDLLKPVTDIMSVTLLSQVFSVQSQQCHVLSHVSFQLQSKYPSKVSAMKFIDVFFFFFF